MKVYNFIGYLILFTYAAGCMFFSPGHFGPLIGLLVGVGYFIFFWFLAGVYLADVLHLGIAHRSLDYRDWFVKFVVIFNNLFGVYVDPIAWVNRHRLHHKYSDHEGDPNKLGSDGPWRTLYLCLAPYRCTENLANDQIFRSWPFRLVSNWYFLVISQLIGLGLMYLVVQSFALVAVMWLGLRIFAVWVNMVQNYWTHSRQYGYRRYQDEHDNAMNIGEWLPVTATFSACLQNNHHHHPGLLRLSHHQSEYDFGFLTVRMMKRLGLVTATAKGSDIPGDVPLQALNF